MDGDKGVRGYEVVDDIAEDGDLTMQTALQIRLLLPIITEGYVCRCGELMDRFVNMH